MEAGVMKFHRRNFLRLAASGLGSYLLAGFLSACRRRFGGETGPQAVTTPEPTLTPAVTVTDTPMEIPPSQVPDGTSATATPFEPAYLAVARGGDDPQALVRSAVAAIGGMSRFVNPGARVVIKPNICTAGRSYEHAATTNPWVVAALVRLCREADASRVLVLDYPFYKSSKEAYADSGIQEEVEAAGGEVFITSSFYTDSDGAYVWVDYDKWLPQSPAGAKRLKSFEVIDEVNVPIAKDHDLTRLTLGMKNLMGVVHNRPAVHSWIAEKLPELAAFLRPALTIVDAVRVLTANGPRGGNLNDVKKMDTVIASHDIVAADSYAATLFGLAPGEIGYIAKAAEAGLGTSDLASIRIQDILLDS
jgi:uncharacterized protein (DUF362 family)